MQLVGEEGFASLPGTGWPREFRFVEPPAVALAPSVFPDRAAIAVRILPPHLEGPFRGRHLVGEEGFEPSIRRIKTCCLTTWLLPRGTESVTQAQVFAKPGVREMRQSTRMKVYATPDGPGHF